MKKMGLCFFLLLSSILTFAYDSGIAIKTDKGISMQVFVNGRLYNNHVGKMVRVRSTPGLFHLEVKVLNPWNKKWYTARKSVRVEKGFEFQYKVVFINKLKPEVVAIRKYPIYSKYFLNPSLYNKHPIS
ncbi:MAG TPA: hypothetical protein VGK59_01380 [Ohtaekwangia sp.]